MPIIATSKSFFNVFESCELKTDVVFWSLLESTDRSKALFSNELLALIYVPDDVDEAVASPLVPPLEAIDCEEDDVAVVSDGSDHGTSFPSIEVEPISE
jgi:hypothetical protein